MYFKLDAGSAESQLSSTCESDSENETGMEKEDDSSLVCECLCCTLNGPPSEPLDVTQSKHAYSYQNQRTTKTKSYKRSIQPSWYKKHPWISVCRSSYKIYCHYCRYAKKNGLLTLSVKLFCGEWVL